MSRGKALRQNKDALTCGRRVCSGAFGGLVINLGACATNKMRRHTMGDRVSTSKHGTIPSCSRVLFCVNICRPWASCLRLLVCFTIQAVATTNLRCVLVHDRRRKAHAACTHLMDVYVMTRMLISALAGLGGGREHEPVRRAMDCLES
jgi:hypothetical protein